MYIRSWTWRSPTKRHFGRGRCSFPPPHKQHCGVLYLEQLNNAIESESDTSSVYLPSPIDCETQIDEGDPFDKVQGSIQFTPTQIDADNDDLRGGMDHIVYSSSFARCKTEHIHINNPHTRGSQ